MNAKNANLDVIRVYSQFAAARFFLLRTCFLMNISMTVRSSTWPDTTPQSCCRACRSASLLPRLIALPDCLNQEPFRILQFAGRLRRDSTTRRQPILLPPLTVLADQKCGTSWDAHRTDHKRQSQ